MYTRYDVVIIQGKMPSRRSGSKRCSTTRTLDQKTPISMIQKHAWWASRQHGTKGMSIQNTCMMTARVAQQHTTKPRAIWRSGGLTAKVAQAIDLKEMIVWRWLLAQESGRLKHSYQKCWSLLNIDFTASIARRRINQRRINQRRIDQRRITALDFSLCISMAIWPYSALAYHCSSTICQNFKRCYSMAICILDWSSYVSLWVSSTALAF